MNVKGFSIWVAGETSVQLPKIAEFGCALLRIGGRAGEFLLTISCILRGSMLL